MFWWHMRTIMKHKFFPLYSSSFNSPSPSLHPVALKTIPVFSIIFQLQHYLFCHPECLLSFHFCLFSMTSLPYDAELYPKLRGAELNFRQRPEYLILNSDPNLQFPVFGLFDTAFQLWHSHAYFILTFPSVWECCCLGQRTGIPESGTHILLNYSLHGLYD